MKSHSQILESLDIAKVPSGFPVGFSLLTVGRRQYVAFYDAEHRMCVAFRMLEEKHWQYHFLPSSIGWDSHNSVTMAIDDEGHIHLSGNMHAVPLIYFRTRKPWDAGTFERIPAMTGELEDRCTYPQFTRDAENRLIFHYRDGGSGNGNEIYNVYDPRTRQWKRYLNRPLTDGLGRMNAYLDGPSRGPDGRFHLCWVWRDTPDARTNHDPSYARSRDLKQWETIRGEPIELPITIETPGVTIDPVLVDSGLINGCLHIGFDSAHTPLASYHKFDEAGNTQVYVARFESGQWATRKVTDWDYRWDFAGVGAIEFGIVLGTIRTHGVGRIALPYQHIKYGRGLLIMDEKTLEPLRTEPDLFYPPELCEPESDFPEMQVRWAEDLGENDEPSRYVLRWETLPSNRDQKRPGPLPQPSMLRFYRLL